MDTRRAKRLILPATLVVTTFISASSCKLGDGRDPDDIDYCVDIENMSDCDGQAGCAWSEDVDHCINTCADVVTQVECEQIDRCEWSDFGESDTGGGESCHQPFT